MEQITGKIKEIIHYANGFGVIKFSYGKTSRTAAGRTFLLPRTVPSSHIPAGFRWGYCSARSPHESSSLSPQLS